MGLIRRAQRPPGRRRRRFSLNALAIQLSAFALSFTLVALLVVAGSQAAFVEESEAVSNYVPIGAPPDDGPAQPRAPRAPRPSPPPAPEEPVQVPVQVPVQKPVEEPSAPIELTDSDAGSAMFSDGTTLAPGSPLDRCIEVAYHGDEESLPVRLYASAVTGDLAPYLDLTIEVGQDDAGTFGDCAGFRPSKVVYRGDLADFSAQHPDYGAGLTTWRPDGTADARSFRFRIALRDEPAASGRSVSFGFTWESRTA